MFNCVQLICRFIVVLGLCWIVQSKGINIQSCDIGCTECNDTLCVTCDDRYYMCSHNGTYTCRMCPETCITCQSDLLDDMTPNCTSCIDGHYLNKTDGLGTCSGKCSKTCKKCMLNTNNTIGCLNCIDGYYLHVQNELSVCSECPETCRTCQLASVDDDTASCTNCIAEYRLKDADGKGKCEHDSHDVIVVVIITVTALSIVILFWCSIRKNCNYLRRICSTLYNRCCIYSRRNCCPPKAITATASRCSSSDLWDQFETSIVLLNTTSNETCKEADATATSLLLSEVHLHKEFALDERDSYVNSMTELRDSPVNESLGKMSSEETGQDDQVLSGDGNAALDDSRVNGSLGQRSPSETDQANCGPELYCDRPKDIRQEHILHNTGVADKWDLLGEQIYYDHRKVLGKGSKAIVYEGRYGQSKMIQIAVKRIDCTDSNDAQEYNSEVCKIYREIKTIEHLNAPFRNPNIVHFIHSYTDTKTVYIAFELGKGTLIDYVKDCNKSWRETLTSIDVVREISNGLKYIHQKSIVHRDLKPANILIVARDHGFLKAVIGDFGTSKETTSGSLFSLTESMGSVGYIAPEIWEALGPTPPEAFGKMCDKRSDIYSAALVFYYTITSGEHLFGHKMKAQGEIEKGSIPTFKDIASTRNTYALQSLLESMLNTHPEERPKSDKVCSHPGLWKEKEIIVYLANKSDDLENMIKTDPSNIAILEDPLLIPNRNWMNNLPVETSKYLKQYRVNKKSPPLYSGKETNVRSLLRVIRNTNSHYKEYPQNVQLELGNYPEGHVDLWLQICPKLLMHVVKKLGVP